MNASGFRKPIDEEEEQAHLSPSQKSDRVVAFGHQVLKEAFGWSDDHFQTEEVFPPMKVKNTFIDGYDDASTDGGNTGYGRRVQSEPVGMFRNVAFPPSPAQPEMRTVGIQQPSLQPMYMAQPPAQPTMLMAPTTIMGGQSIMMGAQSVMGAQPMMMYRGQAMEDIPMMAAPVGIQQPLGMPMHIPVPMGAVPGTVQKP